MIVAQVALHTLVALGRADPWAAVGSKAIPTSCNTTIAVKHIVVECAGLLEVRRKCLKERSSYSLF